MYLGHTANYIKLLYVLQAENILSMMSTLLQYLQAGEHRTSNTFVTLQTMVHYHKLQFFLLDWNMLPTKIRFHVCMFNNQFESVNDISKWPMACYKHGKQELC